MTKKEWLQICRLNQEWYFRSVIDNPSDEWIKEHMPNDSIFDDGRIEFFEKNFKKESIDEEKLDDRAEEYAVGESDYCGEQLVMKDAYKAGYRKAMEEMNQEIKNILKQIMDEK